MGLMSLEISVNCRPHVRGPQLARWPRDAYHWSTAGLRQDNCCIFDFEPHVNDSVSTL